MEGKLMIVSWTLYPWTSGSSIIVNNIASQFGKEELVLFGEKEPIRSAKDWPKDFPNLYHTDPNLRIKNRGQRHLRWFKFNTLVKEICRVAKQEKVSKILCIFPDDFYLYAAYRASKKLNIPLYTWFHNTYLDNYSGYRKQFAKWFQPKVFQYAKKTFVMSDGMLDYYKKQYPDNKFETLVHGFPLPEVNFQAFQINKDKVRFVFTGSLNSSCEDATIRLMSTILKNPRYEVHVYTGNPIENFTRHGLDGKNFFYHGFIQLNDLYEKLSEYDIMLLPHGFDGDRTDIEFKTIFPTRTIPLLTSNRPILAHSPKGVFLTRFLEENECAAIVDTKDTKAIELAIEKIIDDKEWRNALVKAGLKTAQHFSVVNIANKIRESLGLQKQPMSNEV